MKNLEDAWQKILASDEYSNYNDEVKVQVKQRFFERTVGASKQYQGADYTTQQKIQSRFEERINPSMLSKIKKTAGEVSDVLKAEVKAKGVGGVLNEIDDFTPAGAVAKKAGELGHKAVEGIKKSTVGETITAEQYKDINVPGATEIQKNVYAGLTEVRNAAVRTGKEVLEGAIPESKTGVRAQLLAEPVIDIAKGLPILGADVGKMAESFIGKFRSLKELPPVRISKPLGGLLDDEKAYETKLKDMAGMNGNPLYEPFTPEFKTNISQLHDYHQEKLMDLKAEEPHMGGQAQAEEDINYQKKLESMPGADKEQPPLIPFKQMLQPGQEGKLMGKAPSRPEVSDIIKPEIRHTMENIAAEGKPKDPFLQNKWQSKALGEKGSVTMGSDAVDPDIKKFTERNLSDITQKPLRGLLKEINDDLGHIGSVRFSPSDEDPAVLEAAKDLRVAVKLPSGSIFKDKFGADAHGQTSESAKTAPGAIEGFWDEITKKFYSREDSAKMLGWSDQRIKSSGGLMAKELRDLHNSYKKLGEKGEIRIGAGGRAPVKAVGQDDYDVLNAAKDLRVAVKLPDGKVEVGNFGDSHNDAFADKIPDAIMNKSEYGFYDNITKKFISREEGASYLSPNRKSLLGQELGDLHRAGSTYLGNSEKGLHSEDLAKIKDNVSSQIIKQINKEFGEKGHVWADADPVRWDRIKQNVRELLRRASKVGYDATDEVMAYADRNYICKEELRFLNDELKKEEPAPFDPRPISEVLQAAAGSKDAKNTLWEKVKDRWTPDGTASKVKTLLTKRYGEIAEGHVDSQYFIHNTLKQLTKTEREAMAFKGVAPEDGRLRWPNAQEITKLVKKPTENMKAADKALTKYMEEAHSFLSENFDDVGYVKDYVSLMWDKAADVLLNPASNESGTYNPFLNKRSFPNYAAGINAGQQPKTLDIRDIVSIYDKYKIKTVANVKFFDELAKMPTPQGLPAVMPANRAPIGWIKAKDIPALVGKRVHPDYLQAIKVVTDAPFSNKALRAYDLLAESQRYASLTLSPFHFGSLFINGSLSTDIPFKIPLKVLSTTGKYIMKEALADKSESSMWSKVLTAYKDGHAAFIDLPLSKRAVRAGLNIGMVGKEQIGPLENFLMSTEAKLNKFYMGKGIKAVRGVKEILDKPMWDYIHAGMKIMTFQEHLIDNMKKFPDMPIQELERKTASFVNDLDGGEAWETLFVSPQYQKSLHRAFFFPDWMVSRLRILGEVVKPVGLDTIKNATTRSPEAYQAQKFWLRAGVGYYTFANWRNYVNTKKAYGQGRFMWDNDPGKKMDVFSSTDYRGRAIYNNYAPAITEVFKWFMDPVKAIGSRFNPNLNLMTEFFTGTTLSGYKLPEKDRGFTSIMKRHYAPIIVSGGNEMGLFPTSKGMSSYEVVKRFEGVIKNGDDPSVAIKFGTQNGYDIEKLYNIAQRNVRGSMRKEALTQ